MENFPVTEFTATDKVFKVVLPMCRLKVRNEE